MSPAGQRRGPLLQRRPRPQPRLQLWHEDQPLSRSHTCVRDT
ncbi:hypothetical protein SLNWT_2914 [Streptomyces albus]|uniref:Uncharacterized protein n=1 Tax=Streptomyces albus (strain ATCC 21838 / DSM 41398 / FERM P-419 / JCM 4703 / NBRC 107858) TaxID=1081613 RepID=A0A0B5EVM9_STRA4|nr:hypothetical protein SLNWT_2914 [Streptomyces albus]AOU77604.1 hypothetical protein SLNHY_2913 [Streptomyces albus]AYN33371.1 hypothetical protein DUI70_2870 [Streptomyces albus]